MLQHHFTESVDMVGMEMRQEDGFHIAPWQTKFSKPPGRAGASIYDEDAISGGNNSHRADASRIWQGRAGADQNGAQSIRCIGQRALPEIRLYG